MHGDEVSTNYDWLEHNLDNSKPVPEDYQDMPIQPLGDRASFYLNYINGCVDYYNNQKGQRGNLCISNEDTRLRMNQVS